MIEWFRTWHGAPTDPKYLVIARKAGVPPGIVAAIVWALLDHASQADDRGSIEGFDVETYAAFSQFDESIIESVIEALRAKGVIEENRFAAWERRQPRREREGDKSTDRVRAFRERKRRETPCNASGKPATPSDTETDSEKKEARGGARAAPPAPSVSGLISGKAFPRDGTIEFTPWADLVRRKAPGQDVDRAAQRFRSFCAEKGIRLDAPHIAKTAETFFAKLRPVFA